MAGVYILRYFHIFIFIKNSIFGKNIHPCPMDAVKMPSLAKDI